MIINENLIVFAKKYIAMDLQFVLQTGNAPLSGWQKDINTGIHQTEKDIDKMITQLKKRNLPIDTLSILMSNGIFALDIDLKHIADEEEKVNFWSAFQTGIKEKLGLSFWKKLVIEKTKSNGFHFYFRADINDTKDIHKNLAYTKEKATLIEFLKQKCTCYPTANYELIQGDFSAIATITTNELNTLIDFCKSLCKKEIKVKPIKKDKSKNNEIENDMPILDSEIFDFCFGEISKNESFVKGNRNSFLVKLASYCKKKGVSENYTTNICIDKLEEKDFTAQQITSTIKNIYGDAKYECNSEPYQRAFVKSEKEKDEKKEKNTFVSRGDFYSVIVNKYDEKFVHIDIENFLKKLKELGFYRYDIDDNFVFVQIKGKIVKEVTRNKIIDTFLYYLESIKKELKENHKLLFNKFCSALGFYFSEQMIGRLTLDFQLDFIKDKHNESYYFYKNGIVVVNKDTISLKSYDKISGFIWEKQIIERNFQIEKNENILNFENKFNVFEKFCFLISKRDIKHFASLMTIIGYLLHDYQMGKKSAINFTDSSLDIGTNDGRSGKTLLCKALGFLRVYTEVNGKNFSVSDKHRYQQVKRETQIVNLNDINSYFKLEWIYNDITEYVEVDRKNKDSFNVVTKMVICSNKPLTTNGGSDRDRVTEFEFCNYFSEKYSPQNEFNHWFFKDWNREHWQCFDNFMLKCVKFYLEKGIIKPQNTNLAQRKLLSNTSVEFVEFCNEQKFEIKKEYNLKKLYEDFSKEYDIEKNHDYKKFSQQKFTNWLKIYVQYANLGIMKDRIDRKPAYDKFIWFEK